MQEEFQQNSGSANLKYRLNPDDTLRKIETYLKGRYISKEFNADTGEIETRVKKVGQPLLNEIGIQKVMSVVTSVVNHNTVLGNLDMERYSDIIYDMHTTLAQDLMANKKYYGIRDNSVYSLIITQIMMFVKVFLSRTIDDMERKHIGKNTQEVIQTNNKGEEAKSFFGFRGRR